MTNGNDRARLKDGSEWAEHEDFLIANEAGLRNLIRACEAALEHGVYESPDLGDYVGVRKLDAQWFEEPPRTGSSFLQNATLAIILLTVLVFALIGMYSTVSSSM